MNRGFSLLSTIALVTIIGILVIGAYFLGQKSSDKNEVSLSGSQNRVANSPTPIGSPSVNETENWKTLSDNTYGFSIKYPADWTITDRISEGIPTVKVSKFFNFENRGDIKNGNWAHLRLDSAINEAKINEWNNTKNENSYSKAQIETSDFNGQKLYRATSTHYETVEGMDKETYTLYAIYIPTKDGYIQLASNLKMKETLEKILTTFETTK